jgi:hypothetical protein
MYRNREVVRNMRARRGVAFYSMRGMWPAVRSSFAGKEKVCVPLVLRFVSYEA